MILILFGGSVAHAECKATPADIANHAGALLRQSPEISTISPDERAALACLADAVETLAKERDEAPRRQAQPVSSGRATPGTSAPDATIQ